jgi:hypothetical protein
VYHDEDVDPSNPELREFTPKCDYIDLNLTWSDLPSQNINTNFVVLTSLYTSEGTYIARAALYDYLSPALGRYQSLRLITKTLNCFDDSTLGHLDNSVNLVSWIMYGKHESYAMINGNISAKARAFKDSTGKRCSDTWSSLMEQGEVARVRVAVHNFHETNLDKTVKIEWRVRPNEGIYHFTVRRV